MRIQQIITHQDNMMRILSYTVLHTVVAMMYVLSLTTNSAILSMIAILSLMALYVMPQPWHSRALSLTVLHSMLLFLSSYWLIYSLHDMLKLNYIAAIAVIASAAILISPLLSLPIMAYHLRLPNPSTPISCSLLLIIGEYIRQQTFLATPWLNFGSIALNIPLLRIAFPIGGAILASYLLLRVAELAINIFNGKIDKDGKCIIIACGLLTIYGTYDYFKQHNDDSKTGTLEINLIQGNIDHQKPHDPFAIWEVYLQLIEKQNQHSLSILPEGILSFSKDELTLKKFSQYKFLKNTFIGVNFADHKSYNSMLVGANQAHGHYRKQRYVPFGEYLPMSGLLGHFVHYFDNKKDPITEYSVHQLRYREYTFFPMICYDLFFEPLQKERLSDTDGIIVIAENTWFRDSLMQTMFLRHAQQRAIEYHKPVLLAMNRGYSAHITAAGKIEKKMPFAEQSVLHSKITKHNKNSTPYSNIPDGMVIVFLVALESIGVLWTRSIINNFATREKT